MRVISNLILGISQAVAQPQPEPGDHELSLAPALAAVAELSGPIGIRRTTDTGLDAEDSMAISAVSNRVGAAAALDLVLVVLSKGVWHLECSLLSFPDVIDRTKRNAIQISEASQPLNNTDLMAFPFITNSFAPIVFSETLVLRSRTNVILHGDALGAAQNVWLWGNVVALRIL